MKKLIVINIICLFVGIGVQPAFANNNISVVSKNEQIIFGKAASDVKCLVCGEELAKSTGGKAKIVGQVLEVLS